MSFMMDVFVHWPKSYFLFSATCDEVLSWMVEIWMKIHLISDGKYSIVDLKIPQNIYKE